MAAGPAAPWEEPARPAPGPWERTEPAPAPRPAGPSIPQPSAAPVTEPSAGGAAIWRELAESSKGALPPMYRAFLGACRGTVDNGVVTVFAPDDVVKGRLDNDRVLNALRDSGESLTGGPVTVRLVVGEPPKVSPADLRKNLIAFGSQFDNIEIK